jgi:hypothetical protein
MSRLDHESQVYGAINLIISEDTLKRLSYVVMIEPQLLRGISGWLQVDAYNALHILLPFQPSEQVIANISGNAGDSYSSHFASHN